MEIMRGYVFRLKPSKLQERKFRQYAGVCRLVYNLALEQRSKWGKSHGCNYYTAVSDLKELRAQYDFIRDVSQMAQTQALRDLDSAFRSFFAKRAGFPSPRKKGRDEKFRFSGREVSLRKVSSRHSEVKLPKLGWVRFIDTRPMRGEVRNATVTLSPLGWHISIMCKYEVETPTTPSGEIGVDRGVAIPMMLSDGSSYVLPNSMAKVNKQHKRVQRVAARRKRGSNRWVKAMKRARSLKSKEARIRSHWQHETTTVIARKYGHVVMEALKTSNMTKSAKGTADAHGKNVAQKSGLNRAILNVGWYAVQQKLAYKLEEKGGHLSLVNPSYTSQTCSSCGVIDKAGRKNQASFSCLTCGFACNADLNAAINIKRRGNTALLDVEGSCTKRPFEASTTSVRREAI